MSVVFSAASPDLIVMTVDSAVELDFEDHREYTTGQKAYLYSGVGCVTTWGARDLNKIRDFLERQNVSPHTHSVNELAELVNQFLLKEYRPRELHLEDVGYHVAGFDRKGQARLYHVFWGFDRPRHYDQVNKEYKKQEMTPISGQIIFLYNGRNDLVEVVVNTLLEQIPSGYPTRFNFAMPAEIAYFADFVARFAAELTPEVGPPFLTYLISPSNEAKSIRNNTLCPINPEEVCYKLKELGYQF